MDRLQEASDHLRDVTDLAEKIRELRAELQRTREALRELDEVWGEIASLAITGRDNRRLEQLRQRRRALLADEPDTKEGE